MKNLYLLIIFTLLTTQTLASTKKDIIKNLQKTNNLSFNFEQNIFDAASLIIDVGRDYIFFHPYFFIRL